MLADFYISRLETDMKLAVEKKSFSGSNFHHVKKRRQFSSKTIIKKYKIRTKNISKKNKDYYD